MQIYSSYEFYSIPFYSVQFYSTEYLWTAKVLIHTQLLISKLVLLIYKVSVYIQPALLKTRAVEYCIPQWSISVLLSYHICLLCGQETVVTLWPYPASGYVTVFPCFQPSRVFQLRERVCVWRRRQLDTDVLLRHSKWTQGLRDISASPVTVTNRSIQRKDRWGEREREKNI